jgi:hypothetical protein
MNGELEQVQLGGLDLKSSNTEFLQHILAVKYFNCNNILLSWVYLEVGAIALGFYYDPAGYVITGDLKIINTSLRDVFTKGPKYRESLSINSLNIST